MKSKHHSYYEIVENKDKKKKKLEFENTSRRTPPPGFEFVPVGNPELTTACKELSREQDAMIFVVSNNSEAGSLSQHMNRIGYHIREAIVQQARREVSDTGDSSDDQVQPGVPEPIPDSQDEINAQADLAIRDLFPRIPNTDRVAIIEHAFRKLCLDVLVKWRGDEETGRDQLDEILREVIVISDSEGEDDDDNGEDDEADSSGVESGDLAAEPSYLPYPAAGATGRRVVPEPGTASRRIQRPLAEPEAPVPMYRDETGPIFVQPVRPYMQEGYADHRARPAA
ncbi:hypothetical protein SEUCBS140593_007051 [Sporothrix eucalyptigena]|uniref:DUF2293 domain-containing protein n=1 Tax=Sporothrix eucalyptigena TaxID=1812306 RepID=A0ABP0CAL7_9PEZI